MTDMRLTSANQKEVKTSHFLFSFSEALLNFLSAKTKGHNTEKLAVGTIPPSLSQKHSAHSHAILRPYFYIKMSN
jgi:hypothetical protein